MTVDSSNERRTAKSFRAPLVAACVTVGGALAVFGAVGPSGAAQSHASRALVVSTMKTAKFGTILVSGRTLYTLSASPAGCARACQKYWPEVLLSRGVTHAVAGPGVAASKLGTIRRGDRLQVTYAGKALYWFALDAKAGQVHGNLTDAWGRWSVVPVARPATTGVTTTVRVAPTTVPPTTTTSRPPSTVPPTTVAPPPGGGGVGF